MKQKFEHLLSVLFLRSALYLRLFSVFPLFHNSWETNATSFGVFCLRPRGTARAQPCAAPWNQAQDDVNFDLKCHILENIATTFEIIVRTCWGNTTESTHYCNFSVCLRKVLTKPQQLFHFVETIFTHVKVGWIWWLKEQSYTSIFQLLSQRCFCNATMMKPTIVHDYHISMHEHW